MLLQYVSVFGNCLFIVVTVLRVSKNDEQVVQNGKPRSLSNGESGFEGQMG